MSEQKRIVLLNDQAKKPPAGRIALLDKSGNATFFKPIRCDICFVIDTTGSMNDKIDGLLQTCQRLVDALNQRTIDWQVAIVGFGDLTVRGDTIQATSFSKRVDVVKRALGSIPRNSGGGNTGESSLEALERALSLQGYRPHAIKSFILLTDEPALIRRYTPAAMTDKLVRSEVITFVISEPINYFKEMAARTGGEWFQIGSGTDFVSVLDRLIRTMGDTVMEVQRLADGSVEKYLQLKGK